MISVCKQNVYRLIFFVYRTLFTQFKPCNHWLTVTSHQKGEGWIVSYISFYDDGELRAYLFEQVLNFIQSSLFMLLQSIDKYAEQNGNHAGVKISNSKLAKELGITQRSVTTHLSKLQELGFIKISFDRSNSTNTKRYIKPVKL